MGRSDGWRRPLTSETMRIARLILAAGTAIASTAVAAQSAGLSAEDLVGVHSLAAGMAPQWASDGSRILFATSLGGSELWTVPATLKYELGTLPQAESPYKSLSPWNYVDSIQTPLFLVHGEGAHASPCRFHHSLHLAVCSRL
jgi:hypothetical protein